MIEQFLNDVEAARPLMYPEIDFNVMETEENVPIQDDKDDLNCLLTSFVRRNYLGFTKRVLKENYQKWLSSDMGRSLELEVEEEDFDKAAEKIELEALKKCMVMSLYRKAILDSIENVRHETKENHLNNVLIHTRLNVPKRVTKDMATQTFERCRKRKADVPSSTSLEEKMKHFEKNYYEKTLKPKQLPVYPISDQLLLSPPLPINTPLRPPATPTPFLTPQTPASLCPSSQIDENMDEKILQELQELFGEEQSKKDEDEIFGEHYEEAIVLPAPREPSPEIENFPEQYNDEHDEQDKIEEQLKKSLWPCELHYQNQKLRGVMSEIADNNYRHFDKIKRNFKTLFDDDEVDLAPYSPSIELDEILISSCCHRIKSWVVKAMMKPLSEGVIANKFLFKKTAKKIAEGIIFLDQYPSERFIKEFIQNYFCQNRRIQSLADIV